MVKVGVLVSTMGWEGVRRTLYGTIENLSQFFFLNIPYKPNYNISNFLQNSTTQGIAAEPWRW